MKTDLFINNDKVLFESKIDASMAAQTLRYYAGWADKITGDTLPVSGFAVVGGGIGAR